MMTDGLILSIDMGGTKTNIGVFPLPRTTAPDAVARKGTFCNLANADFESPEQLLRAGLAQVDCGPVHIAVIAVAGPVTKGRARLTNLPWTLDAAQLRSRFGWPRLLLINDLEAMALGIPHLSGEGLNPLNGVAPVEKGPIVVIAAGTGLGEAFLTWRGDRYAAHAGEGGHADFAPTDPLQIDLLTFLMEKYGHVSYERICSGAGLWNIYQFFRYRRQMAAPAWLSDLLRDAASRPKTIIDAALNPSPDCDICRRTVGVFAQVLGAEAGNMALRLLPGGGLFLGGGIVQRLADFLEGDDFKTAYHNKGRMSAAVATIPLCIVRDPHTPLYGGAYHGLRALAGES